jgi:hypothetical protein
MVSSLLLFLLSRKLGYQELDGWGRLLRSYRGNEKMTYNNLTCATICHTKPLRGTYGSEIANQKRKVYSEAFHNAQSVVRFSYPHWSMIPL